ncbi:MAG: hypothetical protein PGN21_00970 [Sphingomonas paucimobilis]
MTMLFAGPLFFKARDDALRRSDGGGCTIQLPTSPWTRRRICSALDAPDSRPVNTSRLSAGTDRECQNVCQKTCQNAETIRSAPPEKV